MTVALISSPPPASTRQEPLRVMVVDDSAVIRGLIARWLECEPDMVVAASLRTGLDAVNQIERVNPDVAVLDIEMPDLDGLSALPLLLEKKRDLIVIMASTLTRRNAEVSLKALSLGAADYIPKPETNREVTTSSTFRRDLIEKIRQLGGRRKRGPVELRARPTAPGLVARPKFTVESRNTGPAPSQVGHSGDIKLRPFSSATPRVLMIGSSTGGPQALTSLVAKIK